MRLLARLVALVALLGVASALPDTARAQSPEARAHFARGLELYDEGRLVEALSEFEEAYRLAPTPALLFNLAQLHADLGHAVEATDAYEQFLRDAGPGDAELRSDAERALAVQRARIGRLAVEVSVPGARLFLDDVEIGTSPLPEPVRVSAGEHVVMAQIAGFETQRHRFRIAGGARYDARLVLVPSGSRGASLRIQSAVPGVDIRVDGASMGLTPLEATVPVASGSHRVEGVREGYLPFALDVTAVDGSEALVVVQTAPDPRAPDSAAAPLRIALPDTSSTIRIDGAAVLAAPVLNVPVGLHDVEIRVAEREPIEVRIDVLREEGYELRPDYEWTPDARAARHGAAATQRTVGLGLLVPGAVLLAAGLPTMIASLVWFFDDILPRSRVDESCTTRGDFDPTRMACATYFTRFAPDQDVTRAGWLRLQEQYNASNDEYVLLMSISVPVTAVGAVALIVGSILLGTAPTEEDIDRAARADFRIELDVGLGQVGVHGTF